MTDSQLIGKRLDEYHILSQLGEGGMATIYLGLDTRLHRYTAIKVVLAHLRDDPEIVARFEREARAVAALDHPNIVGLYRYGQVEDIFYMAMQYIEGVDLRIVLRNYRQEGKLIPMAEALRITREICSALDYSHQHGVLHRDVKPSNIMVNREGTTILTDFGLALLPDIDTQGKAFGTPQYMSPEQAQSPADVGPKSDLYSVGMVLYEMFTGEVPFHEIENPMEMLALRATTPPPKPSTIQPEITPELEVVILKALALKPEARYESGAALAAALEKSLPLVEIIATETVDDLTQAVTPEKEEVQAAPLFMTSMAAEAAISPPTAVAGLPPVQAPYSTSSSQRKFAGLPIPAIAIGGCLMLLILAVLVVGGGIQLIRGQLADGYESWIPVTIKGNQEPSSGEETDSSLPDNVETGSAEGRSLLVIATNGDDSLYLINVGSSAVSLSSFQFGEGKRRFEGSEWGIPMLTPGECVSIWKDKGHPGAPEVDCNEVGNRVEVKANETFWKDEFSISFQNIVVTTCPNEGCEFSVPYEQ